MRNTRVVLGLLFALTLAVGAVLWLAASDAPATIVPRTTSQAADAAVALSASPSASSPRDPEAPPVARLSGGRTPRQRTADDAHWNTVEKGRPSVANAPKPPAATSLSKEASRLVSPNADRRTAWDLMGEIVQKSGSEGQRSVLAQAADALRDTPDTRRAAVFLALAQVEFRLEMKKEAAQHMTEAVLAMQPDWAPETYGLPRLVLFAIGPNVEMWAPSDYEKHLNNNWSNNLWLSSGAARWDGGSWIPHTFDSKCNAQPFFDWLQTVAADDANPENAMAATIWVHAVTSRHNWQHLLNGQPPAKRRRVRDAFPERIPYTTTDRDWEVAAADAFKKALDEDAAWANDLVRVDDRLAALKRATDDAGGLPGTVESSVLWSISDEFAARFAAAETPHAAQLRQLATHLAEFPPNPNSALRRTK